MASQSEDLRGRSVLIATTDQLTAALALLELDGVARRMVLCPPDLPPRHLPAVMDAAQSDTIVSDRTAPEPGALNPLAFVTCGPRITPSDFDHRVSQQTEWILLTSGTTGSPKLAVHTLESLAGAIGDGGAPEVPVVWGTFYDLRRYGGLQIFLRAILTGASLALSGPGETTDDYLIRAGARGVTHISGTPSHWRRALMSPVAHSIDPRYVRLSGEIVDQAILDHLSSSYPNARVAHAFASTEAGVAFDVDDGLAGFPTSFLAQGSRDVEMKVESGSLRIRSARTAARYLGAENELRDTDGFVDTGDMVELRAHRWYFMGRRDGVINVGGLKVHPEEVEETINRHPRVRMVRVRTRKSPVTGAVVVADIVLDDQADSRPDSAIERAELRREILRFCQSRLPRHKTPASINFVGNLPVTAAGKMVRVHA